MLALADSICSFYYTCEEFAMALVDKNLNEFCNALASKAPTPGGGGAAALTGALGIALCSMAGNLTLGRKKYADVEADVLSMLEKGESLRERLLALIDKDAEMFAPLAEGVSNICVGVRIGVKNASAHSKQPKKFTKIRKTA